MSAEFWAIPIERGFDGPSAVFSASAAHPLAPKNAAGAQIDSIAAAEKENAAAGQPAPKPIANPLMDDPLSSFSAEATSTAAKPSLQQSEKSDDADKKTSSSFLPWDVKKASILQRYTTDKTISVSKFIAAADPGSAPGVGENKQQTAAEKTRARLEQLDDTEEGMERKVLHMSQKEYVAHIEQLNTELKLAWSNDEKVKAIKIAIQASKFLSDTTVPQFYPSMFVLVTEILDTFGKLVYGRLISRANELEGSKLPENFTPEQIHAEARETCRNWFYKIASIRELVPRIYVELAILRSYRFIADAKDFAAILARLVSIIRGIGDPLVCIYARTYLARCGILVAPQVKDYQLNNFTDLLLIFKPQLSGPSFTALCETKHMTQLEYYDLLSPAIEWILQCAGNEADKDLFFNVMDRYMRHSGSAIILHHIISGFEPNFISTYSAKIIELIKTADYSSYPKYRVYSALALTLVLHPPPEKDRLGLLNDIWKVVRKFDDVREFMEVASAFIEYPLKFFSGREVNAILADVHRKVNVDRKYEELLPQIHSLISKVLNHFSFERVLQMESFLPIVDLFQNQTDISRALLEAYCVSPEPASDPYMIHSLFACGKTLHDSLTSNSTTEDDRRVVTSLLCKFVLHVDYGLDFEKHLGFLVDARRDFGSLDMVKCRVVQAACALAMKTLRVVKGKHTAKTQAFVKGCLAFCFITIPSIDDLFSKLGLYTLASQVALNNGLIGQAEACIKGAITVIPEVPVLLEDDHTGIKTTDKHLTAFVEYLISVLVMIPGNPEQGPYFLVTGLIKTLQSYKWDNGSHGLIRAYLSLIKLLAVQFQRKLPYRIRGVMGNDELFGGDPSFQEETMKLIETLITECVPLIQALETSDAKAHVELTLDLLEILSVNFSLNKNIASLIINNYKMLRKNTNFNPNASHGAAWLSWLSAGHVKNSKELHAKLIKL